MALCDPAFGLLRSIYLSHVGAHPLPFVSRSSEHGLTSPPGKSDQISIIFENIGRTSASSEVIAETFQRCWLGWATENRVWNLYLPARSTKLECEVRYACLRIFVSFMVCVLLARHADIKHDRMPL